MRKYLLPIVPCLVAVPLFIGLALALSPQESDSRQFTRQYLAKRQQAILVGNDNSGGSGNRGDAEAVNGGHAQAVLQSEHHDFGIMDPLTTAEKTFVIRNSGSRPLELQAGETTCKCTLSKISKDVVPPGDQAEVTLTWNTGRTRSFYSHSAKIHTNDPRRRTIDLRISGIVRTEFAAHPAEFVLPNVAPHATRKFSTVVFSESWSEVVVEDVVCSIEGATCSVRPADPAELEKLAATAGRQIEVELPAGMPSGYFQGTLRMLVGNPAFPAAEKQELELPIAGKVLRRLAVYGEGVEADGSVDLGILNRGSGCHRRLILKVRDEHPDLTVANIETSPKFVEAVMTPYQTEGQAGGLYRLELEIPEDAPACVYRGAELGAVTLRIDHPRIEDLTLKLRFAVIDKP